MSETIDYAEMLEIPVSTLNVTKKRGKKRRALFTTIDTPGEPDKMGAPWRDVRRSRREPHQRAFLV